jgi:hypothetical protein
MNVPLVIDGLIDGLTWQFISVLVKKDTKHGYPAADTEIFPLINPKPLIERFWPPEV